MPCRRATLLAPVLLVVTSLALLGGCGGQDDQAVVLAEIGERTITSTQYTDRLGRLPEHELPRDDSGEIVDMSTLAGKRAFLESLIETELMVAKAIDLGYDKDTEVQAALTGLDEIHAMGALWEREIGDPAKFVSEEELQDYYERLGSRRQCDFLITRTRAEAEQALAGFQGGAAWSELVARHHSQPLQGGRKPVISVPWGEFRDEFEEAVYSVAIGEVAGPIETEYGWWLLRVNDEVQGQRPELEPIKGQVLASVAQRQENLRREALMQELRAERGFFLDEEALAIVFEALPDEQPGLDPQTQKPIPGAELPQLRVAPETYDRVILRYELAGEPHAMTVADFKATYDKQNSVQRPKKTEGFGTLRAKISDAAERAILVDEARERGYFEDEFVKERSFQQVASLLIDRIKAEVISYEEYVSAEELQTFYADHGEEYHLPERRAAYLVRCADLPTAEAAHRGLVEEGLTWKMVANRYGTGQADDAGRGGVPTVQVRADAEGPLRDVLFALEEGQVSEPFALDDGWAVVQLDAILPPTDPAYEDLINLMADRIRAARREAALEAQLAEWREQYGVVVHEERLAQMPSWEEAVDQAVREGLELDS